MNKGDDVAGSSEQTAGEEGSDESATSQQFMLSSASQQSQLFVTPLKQSCSTSPIASPSLSVGLLTPNCLYSPLASPSSSLIASPQPLTGLLHQQCGGGLTLSQESPLVQRSQSHTGTVHHLGPNDQLKRRGSSTEVTTSMSDSVLKMSALTSADRPRKRIKLEEVEAPSAEISRYRRLICEQKLREMATLKQSYTEHLTELFFLQNGGNIIDYHTWKKRPTMQLLQFLQSGRLDSDDEEHEQSINNEVKVLTHITDSSSTLLTTPVAISTTLPPAVTAVQHKQKDVKPTLVVSTCVSVVSSAPTMGLMSAFSSTNTPSTSSSVLNKTVAAAVPALSSALAKIMREGSTATTAARPLHKSATAPSNIAAVASSASSMKVNKSNTTDCRDVTRQQSLTMYDATMGCQEAIVERAKQEARVMQKITELRKEGLWSTRRLPKVQEAPRGKAHWDYLLEEMRWLAADFAQERKWKKIGARKIARMVAKYHMEQDQRGIKAEKEESLKLKRIAANLSKMIRDFWTNIEKVVQYKQQSRLEEKRQKALDLHLSFIVDQTEKYSSWLTEGLVQTKSSVASSCTNSADASPTRGTCDDKDFEPNRSETDDEETIENEEADSKTEAEARELEELQLESELPIEELLRSLPPEVLDKPAPLDPPHSDEDSGDEGDDEEDDANTKNLQEKDGDSYECEDSSDEEETVMEQEKLETSAQQKMELDELAQLSTVPIEELMKDYADQYDSEFEAELRAIAYGDGSTEDESDDTDDDGGRSDKEDGSDAATEDVEEDVEMADSDEEDSNKEVGMEFLVNADEPQVKTEKNEKCEKCEKDESHHEITDYAAAAESIQPTGYTLETTQVKTPVPFLLRHTLREYQHVGLEWMATMYDRRLNGILADEMGLGKTIQTIAVLAHLACEHGIWGPHLIVVPTSVMLNWEMELKKWCPAFKILTYYGTQKERKQKRTGWTKTNAFHVCITSYKLVIQDHQSFRRKKWKYFILDEAQNIKNFKSQRWQTLLNFQSQRRLLLTGTPLQNHLMELWSLMHFLMPQVFASHREFKDWFANPLTGMIEGSKEYSENLIRRLHKVLRPFLLRRLKQDVEKQMPKKYEHVIMCKLSKRQRFLYDDFMSQTKTKETLETGHFMSVINILMQLRKVCNHPNLFDPRPTASPFHMDGITYTTASLVLRALEKHPLQCVDLGSLHPCLADMELKLPSFVAHRVRKLQTSRVLIEEIDKQPPPPARPAPLDDVKQFVFRNLSPIEKSSPPSPVLPTNAVSSNASLASTSLTTGTTLTTPLAVTTTQPEQLPGHVPTAKPKMTLASGSQVSTTTQSVLTPQPITVQIQNTPQGTRLMIPSGQLSQLPGFFQILQTSTGQQIITTAQMPHSSTTTAQPQTQSVINGTVVSSTATPTASVSTTAGRSVATLMTKAVSTVQLPSGMTTAVKPVMKVAPISVESASASPGVTSLHCKTSSKENIEKTANEQTQDVNKSPFYCGNLCAKRAATRHAKLSRLACINERRCSAQPLYGYNVHSAVNAFELTRHSTLGYVHCQLAVQPIAAQNYWRQTDALRQLVCTPEQHRDKCADILDRFIVAIPAVCSAGVSLHTSHPPPSIVQHQRHIEATLRPHIVKASSSLHTIASSMSLHCPDTRLIQYDCGKLQTLDLLLRRLKSESHRVLLFTQMTRMLDVLEAFLNYHGHRYLRLDGTTRVEQRQVLMERFNMDKRIFCFILSTRSGGIGVNLTGADTVIFYDSDWNPTMDAQAQDRCHRIGQTRDVHIYRLISEKTIEENILKKANQKRLLGDVAIEGGNFTTAFFKQNTIKELFDEPSGLQSLVTSVEARKKDQQAAATSTAAAAAAAAERDKSSITSSVDTEAAAVAVDKEMDATTENISQTLTTSSNTPPVVDCKPNGDSKQVEKENKQKKTASAEGNMTSEQLEQALCGAEDESDVMAAKVLHAEQKAELAEFDEDIPWDEKEEQRREQQISKVEQELALIDKELTPVERLAVRFMEEQMAPEALDELESAQEEVALAKEEWELGRLKSLKEEEERRADLEEDEMLFTYSRDDAYNQVKRKRGRKRSKGIVRASSPHSVCSSVSVASSDDTNSVKKATSRVDSPLESPLAKPTVLKEGAKVRGRESEGGKGRGKEIDGVKGKGKEAEGVKGKDVDVVKGRGRGRGKRSISPPVVNGVNHLRAAVAPYVLVSGSPPIPSMPKVGRPSKASKCIPAVPMPVLALPKVGRPPKPKKTIVSDSVVSAASTQQQLLMRVCGGDVRQSTPRFLMQTVPQIQKASVPQAVSPKQPVIASKSMAVVMQPWSNPNLVIRTRKAAAQPRQPSQPTVGRPRLQVVSSAATSRLTLSTSDGVLCHSGTQPMPILEKLALQLGDARGQQPIQLRMAPVQGSGQVYATPAQCPMTAQVLTTSPRVIAPASSQVQVRSAPIQIQASPMRVQAAAAAASQLRVRSATASPIRVQTAATSPVRVQASPVRVRGATASLVQMSSSLASASPVQVQAVASTPIQVRAGSLQLRTVPLQVRLSPMQLQAAMTRLRTGTQTNTAMRGTTRLCVPTQLGSSLVQVRTPVRFQSTPLQVRLPGQLNPTVVQVRTILQPKVTTLSNSGVQVRTSMRARLPSQVRLLAQAGTPVAIRSQPVTLAASQIQVQPVQTSPVQIRPSPTHVNIFEKMVVDLPKLNSNVQDSLPDADNS